MRRFILKTLFYAVLVLAGYEGLYRMGFQPVVTDSTLFDRKMVWLQQHPKMQPKFVVIGSSTALYGVRSAPMVRNIPVSYYNISSPMLNLASAWIIIKPIVREFRPEYVLVASNVGDFCRKTDSTYQMYADASPFVRERIPELFYFLDYHSLHQIIYRKWMVTWLHFDPWGEGLKTYNELLMRKQLADNPAAFLGQLSFDTAFQKIHYQALDSMSRWLREQHVKLIFVQCPIRARHLDDPVTRAKVERHFLICDSIVRANGGVFLNHYKAVVDTDRYFFDAVHLWPQGGDIFTDSVVRDLKYIIPKTQPE